jgi:hypothetical protein
MCLVGAAVAAAVFMVLFVAIYLRSRAKLAVLDQRNREHMLKAEKWNRI